MIISIARKEFLLVVKTLRFLVVVLLCLIAAPISTWTLSGAFNKERQDYFGRLEIESRNPRKDSLLNLFRPVPPLYPFVRGIDDEAVNCVALKIRAWNRPSNESTQSKVQQVVPTVDMSFLVGIVLSGLAFLLSYDSISGEKGSMTLSLLSSYALPRSAVVIGKWMGIGAAVLIPLFLGYCLGFIIYSAETGFSPASVETLSLALIFFLSAAYILVIIIIGVSISAMTPSRDVALFLCLGLWGLICFILPQSANAVADYAYPLESVHELQRQLRIVENDGLKALRETNEALIGDCLRKGRTDPEEYEPQRRINYLHMAESSRREFFAIESRFAHRAAAQERISAVASLVSPFACFSQAAMSLAGTGPESHRRFIDEAYRFGEVYFGRIIDTWRNDPGLEREDIISISMLPRYEYREPGLPERLGGAILPLSALLSAGIVFLILAVFAFNRYDVR